VTSATFISAIRWSPETGGVVCPGGSRRGSQPPTAGLGDMLEWRGDRAMVMNPWRHREVGKRQRWLELIHTLHAALLAVMCFVGGCVAMVTATSEAARRG
jgi:hypothetical protein